MGYRMQMPGPERVAKFAPPLFLQSEGEEAGDYRLRVMAAQALSR
ncbi:MAG TPA: hypothetical protein VH253_20140 [Phycisphaerae bacterium]|nr:hypothetical protein [Phycisphaerae bacterium]